MSAVLFFLRLVRASVRRLLRRLFRIRGRRNFFLELAPQLLNLRVALLALLPLDVVVAAMWVVTLLRHVAPVRNEVCCVDS